jgi:hypothetical protein
MHTDLPILQLQGNIRKKIRLLETLRRQQTSLSVWWYRSNVLAQSQLGLDGWFSSHNVERRCLQAVDEIEQKT